jgi:hypothetical protein
MSESHSAENHPGEPSHEEMLSALFAQLVMQQANMAMMLLGKSAHPETGEVIKDIEAARLFIDQLEMLEAKTKGNLSQEEAALLKQSLMSLHLAFVQTVETPPQPVAPPAATPSPETPQAAPPPSPSSAAAEEHHTKFSKKY